MLGLKLPQRVVERQQIELFEAARADLEAALARLPHASAEGG